ncbi:MAG: DUF3991 and TOPRIM domain-containing protein [Vicinamibacterales bacterium]
MDTELERFKTEIDLRQFAQSLGFAPNARESWRGSAVMERGQQDKIIITRDSDNHYIYFSVKADHSGTVIDLAKRYVSENFGEIRKALRRWSDSPVPPAPVPAPQLEKTSRDFQGVTREWFSAADYARHAWLEGERALPAPLLHDPRFTDRLKMDGRGNVLFAHVNADGQLCGFEKKNRGFTGFAAGGEKGLGVSNDLEGDVRIVYTESFIDLLSYAALFPHERTRYRSFGGALSPKQPEIIRSHILALPRGAEVVAATDADDAGQQFAETIRSLSEGYAFREHRPPAGDWNDVLREHVLPTVRYASEP